MQIIRDRTGSGDVGLSVILAIQIAIIFFVAPLSSTGWSSFDVVEMLRFSLAATTILVVARRLIVRIAVGIVFIAAFAASLHWHSGETPLAIAYLKVCLTIAFDLIVAIIVAAAAFAPGQITVHRILGAIILYLYVALIFAGLYRLLSVQNPMAFAGLPHGLRGEFGAFLEFSLGALTTASNSGLAAVDPVARGLASLESVIGQLFPATLVARLVSLHAARRDTDRPAQPRQKMISKLAPVPMPRPSSIDP